MQGGVAIFFGNKFEYEILSNETDNEGFIDNQYALYASVCEKMHTSNHDYLVWCGDFNMIINMQINEIKLKIINIYGPNKDDPVFYASVCEKMQNIFT